MEKMVIDYCGDNSEQLKATGIYLKEDGSLAKEDINLFIIGHQKIKTSIMKVDKKRRDAKRKGFSSYFSVVSLKDTKVNESLQDNAQGGLNGN